MAAPDILRDRLICILGPTGVGKSAFALKLAEHFRGEIVGADSLQVYRQMDIGTAKPTPEERRRIPHHLLDVVDPDQPFDASRYLEVATKTIICLQQARKQPFVVGGTGLYVRALLGGLIDGPPADEALRKKLKAEISEKGKNYLYETLKNRDPRAAAAIHPHDGIRIVRALEVLELTGRSIVEHQQEHRFQRAPWESLRIGLRREREELNLRIDRRTDQMMADGFLNEVEGLISRGYAESLKPMQSLGYRHLSAVVRGKAKLEEAVALIKRDTRMYAKRQMTWFSADREIIWLAPGDFAAALKLVASFLR
ncbi:MAG: tRNA (adenosine(37)-N6)-dimethylallyltransferase MiaA [Syntrophales bacterium]|jgi:tRNA dimethylallyltransferase|nr:tRNA (adenosine(37)-N6)-dimethylallyltransferase MiaA [Syntrophales bacterium]